MSDLTGSFSTPFTFGRAWAGFKTTTSSFGLSVNAGFSFQGSTNPLDLTVTTPGTLTLSVTTPGTLSF